MVTELFNFLSVYMFAFGHLFSIQNITGAESWYSSVQQSVGACVNGYLTSIIHESLIF